MEEFDDATRALLDILREYDLRNSPLDHHVESCNDDFNSVGICIPQEVHPGAGISVGVFSPHINELLPVHFVEGIFLNQCELLSQYI